VPGEALERFHLEEPGVEQVEFAPAPVVEHEAPVEEVAFDDDGDAAAEAAAFGNDAAGIVAVAERGAADVVVPAAAVAEEVVVPSL
jgi:hypothetical protein